MNKPNFSFSIYPFFRFLLLTAFVIASTSSCSKRYQDLPTFVGIPFEDSVNYSVGRFKTSYLADQIHAYFRGNISAPIAVTTFVEIDNLYQSSTFGRILAEQLISELSMRGYKVIEIRLSDAVQIMEDQGEMGLSREVETLRPSQDIAGLVVGTYASSPDRVYVNGRIIDPRSSQIISVGSVEMARTDEISQLLRGNSFASSLERIPVRHLNLTQGGLSSLAPQNQNIIEPNFSFPATPSLKEKLKEDKPSKSAATKPESGKGMLVDSFSLE